MNYNNFACRVRSAAEPKATAPSSDAPPSLAGHSTDQPHRTVRPRTKSQRLTKGVITACGLLTSVLGMHAADYTIDLNAPTVDKWQYAFGGAGGTRTSASTFGAVGSDGFDDRDAQFYTGFDTGPIVPTGAGASNYVILSVTFTLSMGVTTNGDSPHVKFDGTYDEISTYGLNGEQINGDDPGRPMELYGVAYRGEYSPGVPASNVSVAENSPFGPAGGVEGSRYLYPTDFPGGTSLSGAHRDVSNNVASGFNPSPFAIGQVAAGDLTAGEIDEDADIVFTLNLANSDVIRYLQLGLNEGRISFLTNSLHAASMGGPVEYPVFYTKENLLGGRPGRLDMQVQIVPEPSTLTVLLLGFGVCVATWRGGRSFLGKEQS